MIKLIAALGNPGIEHRSTRHNIAWQFVKFLSFFDDLSWSSKFSGSYSSFGVGSNKCHLILPETFMNRSGISLKKVMDFFNIKPQETIVIHDELEMEFGYAGFKNGGGLGGHNGLRSIETFLGTRDFRRFRIGISRPAHSDITSYVLGKFSKDELSNLPVILTRAAEIFEEYIFDQDLEIHSSLSKVKLDNS